VVVQVIVVYTEGKRMRRNFVIASLCLLALASCTGESSGPQANQTAYLSGQDLTQEIIGRPLSSTSGGGVAYTMKLLPDGTGTLTYSGKTAPMTWNMKGDVICFGAVVNGERQSECDKVRAAGPKYDFMDSTTGHLNNIYTPM
jgi:hypothetical protein